ncbi:MAG: TrmJ/YjtD family RNA methyltransferase [Chitinispirillaceae bacterium]|nr:TrmJ/YjtD family RNA methyltransferase [Chitinispirillaceae bacterium]
MEITFVLVNAAVPRNIGAAARAINTMGFSDLRLVEPRGDPYDESAWWMAHGSTGILKKARVVSSLHSALSDCDFCIGTTARKRAGRKEYLPVEALGAVLKSKSAMICRAAVVFGPEEHGLTNADLRLCHCVSTVPLRKKYPSLNLSQAVMMYAYALSDVAVKTKPVPADPLQYAALVHKVTGLLTLAGMPASSGVHRRIIERMALLGAKDLHCINSICNKMNNTFSLIDAESLRPTGKKIREKP